MWYQKNKIFGRMLISFVSLLLVAIILCSALIYKLTSDHMLSSVSNEKKIALETTSAMLRSGLEQISRFVYQARTNKIYYREHHADYASVFLDIQKELSAVAVSSPFIQTVFFYDGFKLYTPGSIYIKPHEVSYLLEEIVGSQEWQSNQKTAYLLETGHSTYIAFPLHVTQTGLIRNAPAFFFQLNQDYVRMLMFSVLQNQESQWQIYTDGTLLFSKVSNPDEFEQAANSRQMVQTSDKQSLQIRCLISNKFMNSVLKATTISTILVVLFVLFVGSAMIVWLMRKNYRPLKPLIERLRVFASQNEKDEYTMMDTAISSLETSNRILLQRENQIRREKSLLHLLSVGSSEEVLQQCALPKTTCYYCALLHTANEPSSESLTKLMNMPEVVQADLVHMNNRCKIFIFCGTPISWKRMEEYGKVLQREEYSFRLGSPVEHPSLLSQSYQTLLNAEKVSSPVERPSSSALQVPEIELENLATAIRIKNGERIRFCIQNICHQIQFSSDVSFAQAVYGAFSYIVASSMQNQSASDSEEVACPFVSSECIEEILRAIHQTEAALLDKLTGDNKKLVRLKLSDLMAYLNCHYLDPAFSIKGLAIGYGTSLSNLSHFFKSQTGETITEYVDRLRIEKAAFLLTQTDLTIADISQQLGFAASSSFIRKFRSRTGQTPGDYRREFERSQPSRETDDV